MYDREKILKARSDISAELKDLYEVIRKCRARLHRYEKPKLATDIVVQRKLDTIAELEKALYRREYIVSEKKRLTRQLRRLDYVDKHRI